MVHTTCPQVIVEGGIEDIWPMQGLSKTPGALLVRLLGGTVRLKGTRLLAGSSERPCHITMVVGEEMPGGRGELAGPSRGSAETMDDG